MKVAIVHELLTMKGGAETFARMLADMFPDAPIYTLLYDEQKLGDWFPKERVRTSILQPRANRSSLLTPHAFDHHLYLNKFPAAIEAFDFSAFDLVISSSSAFAHGIITNGKPRHISYIHSPARYLWDRTHDVQGRAGKGLLGSIKRAYLSRTFHKLRIWDAEAAARADVLVAASKEVQRRIKLYWERESSVIHPPLGNEWLVTEPRIIHHESPPYFLIVSTLAPYKRIDLAIEACNEAQKYLKIVGEGPDMARLKNMAGPTVEFYGRREKDELRDLYGNAIATIFPGDEDFGLVPLESMACGTPVIAYRAGGALETVIDGVTGCFFDEPTAEDVKKTLLSFDHKKYSKENCRTHASKFSKSQFEQQLYAQIDALPSSA